MKAFSLKVLTVYLLSFFAFYPVAIAAPKKSVAVVEVFNTKPSKKLSTLRYKLEKNLGHIRKTKLVSSEKVAAYFNNTGIAESDMTAGDRIFLDAEKYFLNYNLKKAKRKANEAIRVLKRRPGISGSLTKAYLLQAQIELEGHNTKAAIAAVEKAISYNVAKKGLDSYLYPPKLRKFYKKVYRDYIKKQELVKLNIDVRGKKKYPIYANGSLRGHGPSLTIKVPTHQPQLITAGSSIRASVSKVVPKNGANKVVRVSGKLASKSTRLLKNAVGFKKAPAKTLAQESVWLGADVKADRVVLLELVERGYISRMTVSVVNAKNGALSRAKQIDVLDVTEDADSATKIAAEYIAGLSNKDFGKPGKVDLPVLVGKGKKKSNGALWGVLGVVAAGAIAGTAIALSGGGGGSDDPTTTSVSISGPVPSGP